MTGVELWIYKIYIYIGLVRIPLQRTMRNLMRKSEKLVFGTCYLEMCFDPCQRVIIRDLLPSSSSTMGEGMANPTQVLSPPLWRQEVSPKKGLSNPHGDQQPQLPEGTKDLGHSPSPLPTMRLKRETNHLKMNPWTSRGIENHLWTTYSTIQTQKRKRKKVYYPLNWLILLIPKNRHSQKNWNAKNEGLITL